MTLLLIVHYLIIINFLNALDMANIIRNYHKQVKILSFLSFFQTFNKYIGTDFLI